MSANAFMASQTYDKLPQEVGNPLEMCCIGTVVSVFDD
jgi:hypothetical protein